MRKQRFMDLSLFICPSCGKTIPLMRNHGQHRKKNHIKDLYCPFCKEDQKFKEVKRGEYYRMLDGELIYM